MSDPLHQSTGRRTFLRGAVGVSSGLVALAAGCKPDPTKAPAPDAQATAEIQTRPEAGLAEPALPDGLEVEHFHLHTKRPLTLEARRSAMGRSPITPTSRFFVRNNLPMPDASIIANADAWELRVLGVRHAKTLRLTDLKQMPFDTIASVIQCSGNGRKFFQHGPSGSQWATGAAGCAMWTGVRIRDVVEMLGGPLAGMNYMTSTGGEELPPGVDPDAVKVERSIPIEKGLDDCMLVWEMNGTPIPLSHGGPLRLIVPGYYGCNQIKYIKKLEFTAQQTTAKIQRSGYRFRPIGTKGDPSQPSLWRMNVKSWINGPGADGEPVLRGRVPFYGVALSGERSVRSVEYSLDDGRTWKRARMMGPDLGPSGWRAFTFDVELAAGEHTIATRATDERGDRQPPARAENERGYGNNGWRDHALTVTVVDTLPEKRLAVPASVEPAGATKKAARLSDRGKQGKAMFNDVNPPCSACHTIADAGASGAVGPNLDELRPDFEKVKAAVSNGVGAMPPYKGTLTDEQIELIATYVMEATK